MARERLLKSSSCRGLALLNMKMRWMREMLFRVSTSSVYQSSSVTVTNWMTLAFRTYQRPVSFSYSLTELQMAVTSKANDSPCSSRVDPVVRKTSLVAPWIAPVCLVRVVPFIACWFLASRKQLVGRLATHVSLDGPSSPEFFFFFLFFFSFWSLVWISP